MFDIRLINMPFAYFDLPSIALTQLKSITEALHGDKIKITVHYPTHDFATLLGVEAYEYVCDSLHSIHSGMGDWLFRQAAFPTSPDNTEQYLRRFHRAIPHDARKLVSTIEACRHQFEPLIDALITKYRLDEADLIGFSSTFMQTAGSIAVARKVKERSPDTIVVMGGANCEYPMGRSLINCLPIFDYVFSGPSLRSFPQFIGHILAGEREKIIETKGILCRQVAHDDSAKVIGEDLPIDTDIRVSYDEFVDQFDSFFGDTGLRPILPFETSRGCWWGERAHCTFCGLNDATLGYRAMKADRAIKQFGSLFEYSGRVTRLHGVDNILPKNYLKDVLPYLHTPENMAIFYEVKADLSDSDLGVLAQARVTTIQPGIESLHTPTLKLMKKGTTAIQNIRFLMGCVSHGIKPNWNLLVGFPGENHEAYKEYLDIIPRLTHLPPPSGVFPVRFDRFSPYHRSPRAYGIQLEPMDFYSYIYPFDCIAINDLAYYFNDANMTASYLSNMAQWIGLVREIVATWRRLWLSDKRPILCCAQGAHKLYDSRSGTMIEHELDQVSLDILRSLHKPVRRSDVASVIIADDGIDPMVALKALEEKHLVYVEGERILSLVPFHAPLSASTERIAPIHFEQQV